MGDPQCHAEYTRQGGRERGDRNVRCHLASGHPGEHEEADTEVTWVDPYPAEDALDAVGSQPLPGLAQEVAHKDSPGRSFREMSESGLLWLINATVFHPRGLALALSMDTFTGEVTGWDILGDGTEPWRYAEDMNARFAAAEATLASYRREATSE